MGSSATKIEKRLKKLREEALEITSDDLKFEPRPKKVNPRLLRLMKKIPFLTGFLHTVDKMGTLSTSLVKFEDGVGQGAEVATKIGEGLHIAGVVFAGINVLRIPAIMLAAYILGEKVPMTLTNTAKWIYSVIGATLGVTALALPALASPLGLVVAGLALGTATFALGKHVYDYVKTKKALDKIRIKIPNEKAKLEPLQEETRVLIGKIRELNLEFGKIKPQPDDEVADITAKMAKESELVLQLNELSSQLEEAKVKFNTQKEKVQKLYDKQARLQTKYNNLGSIGPIADNFAKIGVAAAIVAGLSLAFVFPPVGLGIALGAVGVGVLYVVARVSYPFAKQFVGWLAGKIKPSKEQPALAEEENPDNAVENQPIHESTSDLVKALNGENAVQKLKDELKSGAEFQEENIVQHDSVDLKSAILKEKDSLRNPAAEHDEEGEGEGEGEGEHPHLTSSNH